MTAQMGPPHPAGVVQMREGAFQILAPPTQQSFAAPRADAPPRHRRFGSETGLTGGGRRKVRTTRSTACSAS